MFCDILGLIQIYGCPGGHYFLQLVAACGYLCLYMFVCMCVCFAWLACQDIWLHLSPTEDYWKWQIKGLSLAED